MGEAKTMVALIGNPVSNKGWGAVVGEQVFTMLAEAGQRHGFDVMDLTGTSFDDSLTAARENRALYDYLVVVGGDGMIALGANAVCGSGIPLGIVAVGSGNDFARGLKLPVNRVKTAVEASSAPSHAAPIWMSIWDACARRRSPAWCMASPVSPWWMRKAAR